MSKAGHIPNRLRPLVNVIANEYLAEPYPTGRELAKKYGTNTQAIAAILAAAGASRDHGDRKRLRNVRNGNVPPEAAKNSQGKIIEVERQLCSEPHLEKPRLCILHDYPGSCKACRGRKESVAGYRSCM